MRKTHIVTIGCGPTTGGAGTSTATARSTNVVRGEVLGVYVKYLDTPPATTDVAISCTGTDGVPTQAILTLTDQNTDAMRYPHAQIHTTAGVAISAEYTPIVIHDYVKVVITGANDGDGAEVWLIIRD